MSSSWCLADADVPEKEDSEMQVSDSQPSFCVQPGPPQESEHMCGERDTAATACEYLFNMARSVCKNAQIC